jgi:hypothetical protein
MTVVSLDSIVKNILIKRGYSLHWWIDFMVYARDIMREIAFDQKIFAVRYCVLPVDQTTSTVDLPNDYQDYCRVSAWVDQYIRPLVEDNSLQLVTNYDASWDVQPYAEGIASETATQQITFYPTGYMSPYWFTTYWNSYGENTGRFFGGVGAMPDTFRIDKTKNQIKINENLYCQNIVLEYISDGMDSDSATHIDAYAQMAIEAGAMWQFKEHNRTYSEGEAQQAKRDYELECARLRARLSDLTIEKMKRIVQGNNVAIKY